MSAAPAESPAVRLRAIVDSGSFMWARDEQTLRDALVDLERLEFVRSMHVANMKRLDALLEGKPA